MKIAFSTMPLHNQKYVGRLAAAVTLAVALFQSGSMLGSIASAAASEITNTTLDTEYDDNAYWKIPFRFSKWFEYYNNSTDFEDNKPIDRTCAHNFTHWDNFLLNQTTGIWVACHDDELPEDCATQPSAPCQPVISYGPTNVLSKMRTVKINFAIYGLAILRLKFPVDGECVDYSFRKDPFSSCAFMKQEPLSEYEAWRGVRFTFDPTQNISFQHFAIELIARFKNDFVLVDKVEATEYLLCSGSDPEEEIVCPGTPTTTRITTTIPMTTTQTTTTEFTTQGTDSTTEETEVTTQTTETTSEETETTAQTTEVTTQTTEGTSEETETTTQTTETTSETETTAQTTDATSEETETTMLTTEATSEETETTTQTTDATSEETETTTQTTEATSEETETTAQTTEATSEETEVTTQTTKGTELSTTKSSTKVTETTTEQPNSPTTSSSSTQVDPRSISIFTTVLLIKVFLC